MCKQISEMSGDRAALGAGSTASLRCRLAELLLNCARIGFNP